MTTSRTSLKAARIKYADDYNPILEYWHEIANGLAVSDKIRRTFKKLADDVENGGEFFYCPPRANHALEFIENYCKHSKGKWTGRPVKLELFQKAKIQLAFGWLDANKKRRFREVVDFRGRKCGKTTETAGVSLFMLIGDNEGGAECYAVANKLDQAKLIFNEAVNMRSQSEAIRAITKKRQSDIYFPAMFSTLKALAADTKTMDGLNAHFFSQDEFHEARDSKIYDVMVQSQAAREQPLAWLYSYTGSTLPPWSQPDCGL